MSIFQEQQAFAAGTLAGVFRGALRFRQACGVLVIAAGFYLIWSAN